MALCHLSLCKKFTIRFDIVKIAREHIVTRTAAAPTHGNQTHVTMRAAATVTGVNATSNARLKQHKKHIFPIEKPTK